MLTWIENAIEQLGYVGIVLLMALENVFPPLPSEIIMPLAGFVAARGELSLTGVILAGAAGSILGSTVLYGIGWAVGPVRLRRWIDRNSRWLLLSEADVDRVEAWFHRYGSIAVFIGRLVPGVRSLISIPAGFAGMGLGRYLVFTTAGTLAWSALLAGAGAFLGENFGQVETLTRPVSYLVFGGLILWIVVRLVRRRKERN